MTRLRVWLLTVLATLCVAGPTVAYWPVLFAVPAVIGQEEAPLPPLPKCAMPYADQAPRCQAEASGDGRCCELLGDCLTTWRKLWQQGRFREAYELAKCAVKAAPDNVEARHAFVVSQMVTQSSFPNALRSLCAQQGNEWTIGLRFSLPISPRIESGQTPAGTFTPDLETPAGTYSGDVECEKSCPLTRFFAMLFGGCKECIGAKCQPCPLAAGCCKGEGAMPCADPVERTIQRKLESPYNFSWKEASFGDVLSDLKTLTGIPVIADMKALHSAGHCLNMPVSLAAENIKLKSALNLLCEQHNLGYVIKDHCLQITTAEKAAECYKQTEGQSGCCAQRIVRGQQTPIVIFYQREAGPNAPVIPIELPPAFLEQTFEVPLPPPCLAPPPPPLVYSPSGQACIPVPVLAPPPAPNVGGFAYGYQPVPISVPARPAAPSQPIRPVLYDPAAETCDGPMPAHVQITQHGRRVQMSSPNYHAQCDRIRGGADGQLILEGNVQLMSRRHGQTMSITAQRVLLNVKDDQFVVEQAEGMESSRVNIAPVGVPAGPCRSETATAIGTAEALPFPIITDPIAVAQGVATGQVILANTYGEEMLFVINHKPYRVSAGAAVPLVSPAGVVNFEIVSPTWGLRARNMVNLPPNETFTLMAR